MFTKVWLCSKAAGIFCGIYIDSRFRINTDFTLSLHQKKEIDYKLDKMCMLNSSLFSNLESWLFFNFHSTLQVDIESTLMRGMKSRLDSF